jgi:hypothetical protein
MRYLITQGIRKWIKTLAFLNHCYLCFLSPPQHPHCLHCLCHCLLPPSRMQVDQSGIISFLLTMRTSILSLCNRSRRRTNKQLWFCHTCISLYAIDCERLQIASAYCENTSTGPPLIPTLSFLRRTFTKPKEPIAPAQCPSRYHLLLQFIKTKQLKWL